jgi:hypothetical protein
MRFALSLVPLAVLMASQIAAPAAQAAQGRNAALLGGLAVGAGAAAILLNNRPARAAPVAEEEEVYERPAPRYVPTCRMERRRVFIDDVHYTYRRVEVCE